MKLIEKSALNKSEFYTEHIKKWQQSGLSQERYCKSVNISYAAFLYWRAKFAPRAKKAALEKLQKFLPVKAMPSAAEALITRNKYRPITVTLPNGIGLVFPLSVSSAVIGDYIKLVWRAYDNP